MTFKVVSRNEAPTPEPLFDVTLAVEVPGDQTKCFAFQATWPQIEEALKDSGENGFLGVRDRKDSVVLVPIERVVFLETIPVEVPNNVG